MTKALPFTLAGVQRAIKAARKAGLTVTGIATDGTVLIGDASGKKPAPDYLGYPDPYVSAAEAFDGTAKKMRRGLSS